MNEVAFVVHGLRSPENLGSIARAMKNFGLKELVLAAPLTYAFGEAEKLAVKSLDLLDAMRVESTLEAGLAPYGFVIGTTSRSLPERPSLGGREAAQLLARERARGKVALLFGSEKRGLSDAELLRCQAIATLPSSPPQPSLNISQSVAILAYELALTALPPATEPPGRDRATRASLEEAFATMQRVLLAAGYLNPQNPEDIFDELRLLIDRAEPSERESKLLLTAFRKLARGFPRVHAMIALTASLLLAAAPPSDPAALAAQLRDEALKGTHATERIRSLTDRVGPRLAGSPGAARAVEWALAELIAAGLTDVHAEPVRVPQWSRGVETAEIAGPHGQRLVVTALGNSVGTRAEGLTAQVVRTESVETLQALLAQKPDAVRGRFVFFDRHFERTKDFKGYGDDVPIRSIGPGIAARAGAVGVLIRSVGSNTDRVPHTGVTNYKDAAPIPAAALPAPDADLLTRRLVEEPRLEVHLTLGCAMLPDADGFNVVGDVRGREKPEEIVVLGAHLDSWDLGQGAVDDGAGVAVVVETAARLAKLKPHPRRTVRVVLYANEENGAKGAKAYFDAHQAELAHHVAALECDSGQDPAFSFHALAGPEGASVMQAMSEALKPLGIETVTGDEFGVDVGAMREAGVPLLNLDQDVSTYFDIHHSPDDTFDKIIPAHVDRLTASYLVVAYLASESAEALGRIPEAQRARTK